MQQESQERRVSSERAVNRTSLLIREIVEKPCADHSMKMAAANPAASTEKETPLAGAAAGKGTDDRVGVGVAVGTAPVPAMVVEVLVEFPDFVTSLKFAQLMRVLLAKWKTTLRLPKKEPGPWTMDR